MGMEEYKNNSKYYKLEKIQKEINKVNQNIKLSFGFGMCFAGLAFATLLAGLIAHLPFLALSSVVGFVGFFGSDFIMKDLEKKDLALKATKFSLQEEIEYEMQDEKSFNIQNSVFSTNKSTNKTVTYNNVDTLTK